MQYSRRAPLFPALIVFVILGTLSLSASDMSAVLGNWTFVKEGSTDLSPFRSCQLTLTQKGSNLTIARHMDGGRRDHDESMTLDLSQPVNRVPQTWWVDNRHLGAYTPHDATKSVRARTLDEGRILRLETDLILETQQGSRAVNIITQYQISPDGQRLTVIELRSTRPRPVTHVFTRTTP